MTDQHPEARQNRADLVAAFARADARDKADRAAREARVAAIVTDQQIATSLRSQP